MPETDALVWRRSDPLTTRSRSFQKAEHLPGRYWLEVLITKGTAFHSLVRRGSSSRDCVKFQSVSQQFLNESGPCRQRWLATRDAAASSAEFFHGIVPGLYRR